MEIESIILSDGIPISTFLSYSISSVIDMIVDIIFLKYTFIKIPKCCNIVNMAQRIGYNLPIILDITFGGVYKIYIFSLYYKRFTIPKELIRYNMIIADFLNRLKNIILTISALFILWFEFPSSLQFPFIIVVLKCAMDIMVVYFKGHIILLPLELIQFILTVIILVAAPDSALYSSKWFTSNTEKGKKYYSCDQLSIYYPNSYTMDTRFDSISVDGGILREYCLTNDTIYSDRQINAFIDGGPCCEFNFT